MILAVSFLPLIGCANKVILHPIDKQDIFVMPKDKAYTPDRDGFFVSKFFMKEVMEAKID